MRDFPFYVGKEPAAGKDIEIIFEGNSLTLEDRGRLSLMASFLGLIWPTVVCMNAWNEAWPKATSIEEDLNEMRDSG